MLNDLWKLLYELKSLEWIELSHTLTNTSPFWEGIPEDAVELGINLVDYNYIEGMPVQIQSFKFPGQFGTHIDYPKHFIEEGKVSDDYKIIDMVLPLVVIDVTDKVAANMDYEITVEDILNFEIKYGKIPENSFVAMRTDWGEKWPDKTLLENKDYDHKEHFPGWSLEALKYLVEDKKIQGIGHETMDTDAPISSFENGDSKAKRYLLSKEKFQVELLKNLNKIPPTGSIIFIAAPKIYQATGLPARVWAIVPKNRKK